MADEQKSSNPFKDAFAGISAEGDKKVSPASETTSAPVEEKSGEKNKKDSQPKGVAVPEKEKQPEKIEIKQEEVKTKESVQQALAEPLTEALGDEDDESFLLEEEGGFIWMFQRMVWGVLKGALLLGVLGVVAWFFWFRDQSPSTPAKTPSSTTTEKKTTKTNTEDLPQSTGYRSDALDSALWNQWIEQVRLHGAKSIIADSVAWLQSAKSFYDVPVAQMVEAPTIDLRAERVDRVMADIRYLLEESASIRQELATQVTEYQTRLSYNQFQSQTAEDSFFVALEQFDASHAESLIEAKSNTDSSSAQSQIQLNARRVFLSRIELYDRALRSMYEIITANRVALVQGIRVVNFPNDPFNTVLTPTEWRSAAPSE